METPVLLKYWVRHNMNWTVSRHIKGVPKSMSKPSRNSNPITPFSSRTFTSSSLCLQQDTPSQPIPQSNYRDAADAVGAAPATEITARKNTPLNARGSDRIDLSSIPGIPSDYIPPGRTNSRAPRTDANSDLNRSSAASKLDALFAKPPRKSENPFEKALRQTGSTSNGAAKPFDQSPFSISSLMEDLDLSTTKPGYRDVPAKIPLRLGPPLGRSQNIDNNRGIDLARAIRMMESKCAVNRVKNDLNMQRFHVRKGQAKKLLRSQRWRALFKKGFLEECARVRKMKNQGW